MFAPPPLAIMWIFRTVHRAAKEELANERHNLRARLGELYRELERGEISEEAFSEEESRLLDRLDQLGREES